LACTFPAPDARIAMFNMAAARTWSTTEKCACAWGGGVEVSKSWPKSDNKNCQTSPVSSQQTHRHPPTHPPIPPPHQHHSHLIVHLQQHCVASVAEQRVVHLHGFPRVVPKHQRIAGVRGRLGSDQASDD
jgi:hypothetical protein